MKKFLTPSLLVLGLLLVLVGGQSVLRAQQDQGPVVINNYAESGIVVNAAGLVSGSESLGALGTRFPNGLSTDSTSPIAGQIRSTTLTVTATSTLQEIIRGSRFTAAFDNSASTSTIGASGLFSIQNTGMDKICSQISLVYTNGYETNNGQVSVSTSTDATAISGVGVDLIPTLVATTSVGDMTTTTPRILTNWSNPGSYNADNPANLTNTTTPFYWGTGVYIHGIHNFTAASGASENYSAVAGRVYVDCFTRQ